MVARQRRGAYRYARPLSRRKRAALLARAARAAAAPSCASTAQRRVADGRHRRTARARRARTRGARHAARTDVAAHASGPAHGRAHPCVPDKNGSHRRLRGVFRAFDARAADSGVGHVLRYQRQRECQCERRHNLRECLLGDGATPGRGTARRADRGHRHGGACPRVPVPAPVRDARATACRLLRGALSPFAARPALRARGLYFASACQDGTVIDRVLAPVGDRLGAQAPTPASRTHVQGYFLERLLHEALFADAGFAGVSRSQRRRRFLLHAGLAALAGIVLIVALAGWTTSYLNNRAYLREVDAHVAEFARRIPPSMTLAADALPPLTPMLDALDALPRSASFDPAAPPWRHRLGLFEGAGPSAASAASDA